MKPHGSRSTEAEVPEPKTELKCGYLNAGRAAPDLIGEKCFVSPVSVHAVPCLILILCIPSATHLHLTSPRTPVPISSRRSFSLSLFSTARVSQFLVQHIHFSPTFFRYCRGLDVLPQSLLSCRDLKSFKHPPYTDYIYTPLIHSFIHSLTERLRKLDFQSTLLAEQDHTVPFQHKSTSNLRFLRRLHDYNISRSRHGYLQQTLHCFQRLGFFRLGSSCQPCS